MNKEVKNQANKIYIKDFLNTISLWKYNDLIFIIAVNL